MQVRCKDLAGRIAEFKTNSGKLETPLLLPVINPNHQTLPVKKIQKMGAQALITNSYLLWKANKSGDVHKTLGFNGPIMTDSGAFQLMQYGDIEVSNEQIIAFQKKIKTDIGVPLDLPGIFNKTRTKKNVEESFQRSKQCSGNLLWAGPIQGGNFLDLRKLSAKKMLSLGFDYYAVGSVVPELNKYEFASHLDILSTVKQALPTNKVVHDFGVGHPMFFAFCAAFGADVFDSAAYALFAKKGRYLTVSGTKQLPDLDYLPCSCPVCSNHQPSELNEPLLAEHNLWVSLEEIRRIKQSIRENSLWELLEIRARAHPALYNAFKRVSKHRAYLESLDPSSKKRFFVVSKESSLRPEVLRHSNRMKQSFKSKKLLSLPPFKNVPIEVSSMYPFGQRVLPGKEPEQFNVPDLSALNKVAEYQFFVRNLFPKTVRIEKSHKTGRVRTVHSGKTLLAAVRAADFAIVPHAIAKKIHSKTKRMRVVVDTDVSKFAKEGKNVFAKFVVDVDPIIRAGMEVIVVDEKGTFLNSGKAILSAREMIDFDEGVAVVPRTS